MDTDEGPCIRGAAGIPRIRQERACRRPPLWRSPPSEGRRAPRVLRIPGDWESNREMSGMGSLEAFTFAHHDLSFDHEPETIIECTKKSGMLKMGPCTSRMVHISSKWIFDFDISSSKLNLKT